MTDTTNDWTARDDWTRDDLTFGELYRSIVKCEDKLRVATTEDLMRGARAAQLLLNNAICVADEQNNERFGLEDRAGEGRPTSGGPQKDFRRDLHAEEKECHE